MSEVSPSHSQTPADLCGFDITISWSVSRLYSYAIAVATCIANNICTVSYNDCKIRICTVCAFCFTLLS